MNRNQAEPKKHKNNSNKNKSLTILYTYKTISIHIESFHLDVLSSPYFLRSNSVLINFNLQLALPHIINQQ